MANLSNINNKFIVTDGGNVLIGNTANSSGRLQIKDTQTSSFNDGLAITRNNAAQTGYINMVGGAFNFNSPGLSYKFRNNGTQTLELNSSGNATFAGMVTVNGGGIDIDNNDDVRLRFDNASVFKAGLQVATTAGDMIAGSAVNDFAIRSQENMLFATGGNTERMRITSGGGVSIGSTNPSLDTSLRVFKAGVSVQARIGESNSAYSTLGQNSLIRFQGRNTANTASVYGDIGLDVDNQLLIFNDPGTTGGSVGTNPMVLDAAGNLGIGTTSPSAKLEVRGTAPTYTNSSTVFWGGTTNNDSHNGIMLSSYGDALGGSLASNLLYSNSNTPTQTNTNRSSGQIKFGNTTVAAKTSDINFGGYYKGTTTFVERMRIDNSGNVGIGNTNPTSALSISKSMGAAFIADFINPAVNGHGLLIQAGGTTGTRYITQWKDALGTERFHMEDNGEAYFQGKVGIGTTTPETPLHVLTNTTDNASTMLIQNGSTGDASIKFNISGDTYSIGIDNSDGDKFKLSYGAVGTNDRIVVDTTGKVGIGITSPGTTLQVSGANLTNNVATYIGGGFVNNDLYHREGGLLVISGTNATQTSAGIAFQTRNTGNTNYWKSSILMNRGGELEFYTGGAGTAQGTRRLLIQSSGAMYIDSNFQIGSDGNNDGLKLYGGTSAGIIYSFRTASTPGSVFRWYTGGVLVGSVSTTTSSTSFNTSSDYRLKENVVKMTGALDRVSQLKPSRFNFIADADKTVDGFLAHEVQEVVPEAITGEKDAIDKDGNPDYQGIDQSKLVPLLVAAIQELKAEIELLKSK